MVEKTILRDSYKEKIKNLKEVDINEYLQVGFKLDEDSILKAIAYFKSCMPIGLKEIILKQGYWDLFYNKDMVDLIIKNLNIKTEQDKKAISTFVYAYQKDKRDFEKLEDEKALGDKLLLEGYTEEKIYTNCLTKEDILKADERLKTLNGLKVICVFDRDKIGLMGSYEVKETHEGKLIFSEDKKALFFMPKRHSKTGQILRTKFYYKEIK